MLPVDNGMGDGVNYVVSLVMREREGHVACRHWNGRWCQLCSLSGDEREKDMLPVDNSMGDGVNSVAVAPRKRSCTFFCRIYPKENIVYTVYTAFSFEIPMRY
jgi:hypothetical protein